MTDDLDKKARIERHKTIRAFLWLVALIIVAGLLIGIYRFVTAPVRAAQETTASVTASVDEVATKVLTVRHVEVKSGRRFAQLADRAHALLVDYPVTEPDNIAQRAFRVGNLRGSRDQVCMFEMSFGDTPVNVFTAADNDDYAVNKAMGGDAKRQIRLVFVTDEKTIGLNAEYDENGWQLLWRRRNAARKPLTDDTASARVQDALSMALQECSPS
jgi:hypothetical protein